MKLYMLPNAPNPRRVTMFMSEKNIENIPLVNVDLIKNEHKGEDFRNLNPFMSIPVLQLNDEQILTESRAICTYLEGIYPIPNLMGENVEERAFIEMADRRVEFNLFWNILNSIRHTHPALAILEKPQFPTYGQSTGEKAREWAKVFDAMLQNQPWMAGNRFTIADITGFCGIESAKRAGFDIGLENLHALQDWHGKVSIRPSAQAL